MKRKIYSMNKNGAVSLLTGDAHLFLVTGMAMDDEQAFGDFEGSFVSKSYEVPKNHVCQFDLNGDIIGFFKDVAKASRATGIAPHAIRNCCNRTSENGKGFLWRWWIDLKDDVVNIDAPSVQHIEGLCRETWEIDVFQSVEHAAKVTGAKKGAITRCLNGEQSGTRWGLWRYADD